MILALILLSEAKEGFVVPYWLGIVLVGLTVVGGIFTVYKFRGKVKGDIQAESNYKTTVENKLQNLERDVMDIKKKGDTKIDRHSEYSVKFAKLEANQVEHEKKFDRMEKKQDEMLKILHEIKGKLEK